MKTLAVKMLDQKKIPYELREYEVNEDELDAETVARKVAMPPEQVYKTLVARSTHGLIVMACIPANSELDLKTLAKITGEKKFDLVPVKELLNLTGYIRGGVSPLAGKKSYPLYLDETAILFDRISISAGRRGLQVLLSPQDLEQLTEATLADLTTIS